MQNKRKALDLVHWGSKQAKNFYDKAPEEFDYGPLNRLTIFKGTHPKVMENMISQMNWKDKLQYSGKPNLYRKPHKHELLKYRLLTWIEQNLNAGRQIGGFKNYILQRNI
jgi:hypothetical protein